MPELGKLHLYQVQVTSSTNYVPYNKFEIALMYISRLHTVSLDHSQRNNLALIRIAGVLQFQMIKAPNVQWRLPLPWAGKVPNLKIAESNGSTLKITSWWDDTVAYKQYHNANINCPSPHYPAPNVYPSRHHLSSTLCSIFHQNLTIVVVCPLVLYLLSFSYIAGFWWEELAPQNANPCQRHLASAKFI